MLEVLGHKANTIFTGISSTIATGALVSVEGVSLDDIPTAWTSEESVQEQCIVLNRNGRLDAMDCSKSRPYICYRKKTQNIPQLNRCGTTDLDYVFFEKTGHCYKFHETGETWTDAFKTCTAEGGYLTIINNVGEAEVLKVIVAKHPKSARIARDKEIVGGGFQDWTKHGDWMTVHGETMKEAGYEQWSSGQPGNNTYVSSLGEYCGGIDVYGQLHDIGCGYTISFICEMDPAPYSYSVDEQDYDDQ